MLILALDTSGDICSVAVSDDNKLLAEYNFAHQRRLTERIPGIVEFVLKDAGTSLKEIEGFGVGLGPGSFTGVRVGVTMAKTWAEVFQKPLCGVSSLEALVMGAPSQLLGAVSQQLESTYGVLAVAPSRKGEVIGTLYSYPDGACVLEPTVLPVETIHESVAEILGDQVPFIVIGECAHWIDEGEARYSCSPEARYIAKETARRIGNASHEDPFMQQWIGELVRQSVLSKPDDPATLTPLYVAPPPIRGMAV